MNEDCQFAFDRLKQVLTQAQVYSDFTIRFTLATDTSDDGLGCILGQVQNSKGVVTGYADRQLLPAVRNYSREELQRQGARGSGINLRIPHFGSYLYGIHFKAFDHSGATQV